MQRALAILAVPALAAASPAPLPLSQAELDRLVEVAPSTPGCAVAIVQDAQLRFTKGFGLADIDAKAPITPDTAFNIASMTKQFTGMAIALLIADGKLSEQDDIRRYLPELRDYGAPIRLENLLNHSSGLRNHMALAAFQPGDHLPSHEEALRLVFRQSAINFAPGTRHQYESPNYVLLAEIVSRVSGMPYDQFLATRIFKPLGMTASGFESPVLARAYAPKKDGGWQLQEKVNRARGSSGLLSTVSDFARWMTNYDRQTVGGKAAFERMMSASRLADGSPITYRYGLVKEFDYAGVEGLTRISHGGQTAAYRSAFSWFPGRGFGDVVMCNHTTDARAVEQKILSPYVGRLKPPQPATVGGAGTAPAMRAELPDRFAGFWYSAADDDVRQFVSKDGALNLVFYGQHVPLTWLGGSRFGIEGQGEFDFSGSTMTERFAGQAVLKFDRLPDPPLQDLAEFAGTYRSRDVDGEVTIERKSERLLLRYPAGEAELTAIGRDHFSAQEFDLSSVRFERDTAGRTAGLSLTVTSGITRLRFAKARN